MGVEKLDPVPTKVPFVEASYQSIVVPATVDADIVTVPGPHLELLTGFVAGEGLGFTVITTVDVAAVQGPAPSGSLVVKVSVTLPLAIVGV